MPGLIFNVVVFLLLVSCEAGAGEVPRVPAQERYRLPSDKCGTSALVQLPQREVEGEQGSVDPRGLFTTNRMRAEDQ